MLIIEVVPGGGLVTSFKFHGLNLYRYHSGAGLAILLSELAFVAFTVFFVRREHRLFKKEGVAYFRGFWNKIEVFTIFLSITTIVFYTITSLYALYIVDRIMRTEGKK